MSTGTVTANVQETTAYEINNEWVESWATILGVDEGRQTPPAWRDVDLAVPQAHGMLDYGADPSGPRRAFGPGHIEFSGAVLGCDPATGHWVSGESHATYLARVDALINMFYARSLLIRAHRPDGTVREAVGKLTGVVGALAQFADPWFGRWKATVTLPTPFWADTSEITVSTPPGGVPTGTQIPLGALAAGNAPITNLEIVFGPGNNPTLLQGGAFVGWDGVISGGRELAVYPHVPELGAGAGAAWTPEESQIRYNPGPSWFEIDSTGPAALTLLHTGGGSMSCRVTGRPTYLTS